MSSLSSWDGSASLRTCTIRPPMNQNKPTGNSSKGYLRLRKLAHKRVYGLFVMRRVLNRRPFGLCVRIKAYDDERSQSVPICSSLTLKTKPLLDFSTRAIAEASDYHVPIYTSHSRLSRPPPTSQVTYIPRTSRPDDDITSPAQSEAKRNRSHRIDHGVRYCLRPQLVQYTTTEGISAPQ